MTAFANISDLLKKVKGPQSQQDFASIMRVHVLIANNAYKAVRRLVTSDWTLAGEADVICRSMLDGVFTVSLLCSNPSTYVSLYRKGGYREHYEFFLLQTRSQYMQEHGQNWLEEYERFLKYKAQAVNTEEDADKKDKYFPHAAQVIGTQKYRDSLGPSLTAFLDKLYVEYYRPLSQLAHLSEAGLPGRAVGILFTREFESKKELIISKPVGTAMICMLSTLHEINHKFSFPYGAILREGWTYLAETVPLHKELYELRYRQI